MEEGQFLWPGLSKSACMPPDNLLGATNMTMDPCDGTSALGCLSLALWGVGSVKTLFQIGIMSTLK